MESYSYQDYRKDIKILRVLRSGRDTGFIDEEPNPDRLFRGDISDEEYAKILETRIAEYEYKNPLARLTRQNSGKTYISRQIRERAKRKIGSSNYLTVFLMIWIGGGILLTLFGISPQFAFGICLVFGLILSFLLE